MKVLVDPPIIEVLAEMQLNHSGVMGMANWVREVRPDCVPTDGLNSPLDLVPHNGLDGERPITDNELLAELAGRKCYDSFGEKGAKRTNREYLDSMWQGRVPHRSTGYHAKMTFFIANVSRRVSHELIRNYVGSDRTEEGSPSQESTRFTHHPGIYIAHPRIVDQPAKLERFTRHAEHNYAWYQKTIKDEIEEYQNEFGTPPKGLARKRIYESAANDLLHSCSTSFIWTTNPMAMIKFFHERDDEGADLEIIRFARTWKAIAFARWPNLFSHAFPELQQAQR